MRRILLAFTMITLLATSAAHAAPRGEAAQNAAARANANDLEIVPIYDPIEPFNRAVFQFNRGIDFMILKPVVWSYEHLLPQILRDTVSAFLDNLKAPVVMLNSALQADWPVFETSLHRFVINSTLGVLGLVDVASHLGLDPVSADFGQTLGKWGVGHGFYVVLPIIGPSSVRDGVGIVGDTAADPFYWVWLDAEQDALIWTRAGLTAVDRRYKLGDDYDNIMNNAVDPYVTFRSIYVQRRAYMVQGNTVDAYGEAEGR